MSARFLKRLMSIVAAATTLGGTCTAFADQHDGKVSTAAANIKHVFVIVLENKSFSDTFGTSTQDPYLQQTLVPMGGLLTSTTAPATSALITISR